MDIAGLDNGMITRLHQHFSESSNYEDALKMLEYDMLYGDQSVYKGELPYQPTDIRMGLREIRITGARCGEKLLSVYGENFTKSSSVCLNGASCYTEFVSPTELLAVAGAREGDQITVQQVSEGISVSQTEPLTVDETHMAKQ